MQPLAAAISLREGNRNELPLLSTWPPPSPPKKRLGLDALFDSTRSNQPQSVGELGEPCPFSGREGGGCERAGMGGGAADMGDRKKNDPNPSIVVILV